MSVLILSPWLILLGRLERDCISHFVLASCLAVLVATLAWRSTGQLQLGYRFILDFLPMILFLFARNNSGVRSLSPSFKALTIVGFVSTGYFLQSLIEIMPKG